MSKILAMTVLESPSWLSVVTSRGTKNFGGGGRSVEARPECRERKEPATEVASGLTTGQPPTALRRGCSLYESERLSRIQQ